MGAKGRTALIAAAALLAGLLGIVGAGPPAGATTFTVTTTADQRDGAGVNGTSLREAFDEAAADDGDDIIELQAGATYQLTRCTDGEDDTNDMGDLDHLPNDGAEADGLTIEGNGATIDQTCPAERVIETLAFGNHVFRDVTITSGQAVGNGGGIEHNGGFGLTMERVAFTDNQAIGAGGGFFHTGGGSLIATEVDVRNNQSIGDGAGIYFNGTVTLTDSSVTGNSTSDGAGGGVATFGGGVVLRGTTVAGNDADTAGAAVASGADTTVEASTIADNLGTIAVSTIGTLHAVATVFDNGQSCAQAATTSTGSNVETGGDLCGLDHASDETNTGDVGLEALADNGAPGLTQLPALDSPLVDAIPVDACGGSRTPDAAGTDRPVDGDFDLEDGCDIGALERPQLPLFVDVDVDHPFFAEIGWMAAMGVSTGFEPGPEYRPAIAVSRQAMSAFMYRLAGEPAFTAPATPTFSDTPDDHPFYDEIEWMAAEGISTGYGDGTYKPALPVSRQAMSAFMYRLAGQPDFEAPATPTFTDTPTNHPFYDEIEWMAFAEISEGFAPGPEYRPAIAVSRQAMSAFMQRLALGPGVGI